MGAGDAPRDGGLIPPTTREPSNTGRFSLSSSADSKLPLGDAARGGSGPLGDIGRGDDPPSLRLALDALFAPCLSAEAKRSLALGERSLGSRVFILGVGADFWRVMASWAEELNFGLGGDVWRAMASFSCCCNPPPGCVDGLLLGEVMDEHDFVRTTPSDCRFCRNCPFVSRFSASSSRWKRRNSRRCRLLCGYDHALCIFRRCLGDGLEGIAIEASGAGERLRMDALCEIPDGTSKSRS
jgi:hypothetical protein